jgi:hypothetical protein
MYIDETPHVDVLAPHAQLVFRSSTGRRWRLGFHVVACGRVLIAPLAHPLYL